jgi:hypothetical protein
MRSEDCFPFKVTTLKAKFIILVLNQNFADLSYAAQLHLQKMQSVVFASSGTSLAFVWDFKIALDVWKITPQDYSGHFIGVTMVELGQ